MCIRDRIDPISQRDYYRLLSFFHNVTPYENSGAKVEIPLPGNSAEKALAVSENGAKPPATFVLLRGNPKVQGDKVEPGFLEVLGGTGPKLPEPKPGAKTSGRRTVLGDWLASTENPLTA